MTAPPSSSSEKTGLGSEAIQDIRRLIERHGAKPVRAAVDELIPSLRGRPKADDWVRLTELLDQDVREVLEGGPSFKRANHAIARAFAEEAPGQSSKSTIRRIEKKLKAKDSRRFHVFLRAWQESLDAHPHGVHLMALEELSAINPKGPWAILLQEAEANVAAYNAKHGIPAETLSMREIEDDNRNILRTGLLALKRSTAG